MEKTGKQAHRKAKKLQEIRQNKWDCYIKDEIQKNKWITYISPVVASLLLIAGLSITFIYREMSPALQLCLGGIILAVYIPLFKYHTIITTKLLQYYLRIKNPTEFKTRYAAICEGHEDE